MRKKQADRILEFTKLAAKFKPEDWKELARLLPSSTSLAPATRELSKRKAKKARKTKVRASSKNTKTNKKRVREKAKSYSYALSEKSIDGKLKSVSLKKLKFAYSRMFNEKLIPNTRPILTAKVTERLHQLSGARRKEALGFLFGEDDASENYRRWLRIIAR